jgi:hypothetical protein
MVPAVSRRLLTVGPGFNLRSGYVVFVEGNVTLRQVSLRVGERRAILKINLFLNQ